jgi:Na+-driven multidrug efflux pump
MPLAIYFAFWLQLGVPGLWLGFTLASIVLDVAFCILIEKTDWEEVSRRIRY